MPNNQIDEELLEMLRCPVGKTRLEHVDDTLVCTSCGLRYPIHDGIPVLVAESAELPEGVESLDAVRCSPDE